MDRSSRCLEYAGVDAAWEKREMRAFSANGAIRSAHAVSNYLLGRLLEEDLHVSCKPMLPVDVLEMNGTMLQGVCLLQIVDIVNIGANFEHRTEDSKGPTRSLKLCLTDGHQTIFGFEYKWLPMLSVKTPRGTKIMVQNVAVRHGMLMLTPETCQLVGASGNDALDDARQHTNVSEANTARPTGAYSAALMTAGGELSTGRSADSVSSTAAREKACISETAPRPPPLVSAPIPPRQPDLPRTAADLIGVGSSSSSASTSANAQPSESTNCGGLIAARPTPSVFSPPRARPNAVNPAVFVDISSEEDEVGSDATDPMVEHLFYSPNTPRVKEEATTGRFAGSRKRSHPESSRSGRSQPPRLPPRASAFADVVDMTDSPMKAEVNCVSVVKAESATHSESPFALLATAPVKRKPPPPSPVRIDSPFLYFSSKTSALHAPRIQAGCILTVRGFMKSVAGFQFNTGVYNLRVLIEDGTATKNVHVDPALVESLMGVPCTQFLQAMQSTPAVAHKLAAKMQVTLMTMQGIMRLRLDGAPDTWTLLQCRNYTHDETHALLARVRHHSQRYSSC